MESMRVSEKKSNLFWDCIVQQVFPQSPLWMVQLWLTVMGTASNEVVLCLGQGLAFPVTAVGLAGPGWCLDSLYGKWPPSVGVGWKGRPLRPPNISGQGLQGFRAEDTLHSGHVFIQALLPHRELERGEWRRRRKARM